MTDLTPATAAPHCACGCTGCGAGRADRADTITALFKRLLALSFRMEKA